MVVGCCPPLPGKTGTACAQRHGTIGSQHYGSGERDVTEPCAVEGFLPRFEAVNFVGKSLIGDIQFNWHETGVDEGDYLVVRKRTAPGNLPTQSTLFRILLRLFPHHQDHQYWLVQPLCIRYSLIHG